MFETLITLSKEIKACSPYHGDRARLQVSDAVFRKLWEEMPSPAFPDQIQPVDQVLELIVCDISIVRKSR